VCSDSTRQSLELPESRSVRAPGVSFENMTDRADLLRVDATGTIHPVGRTASRELRARIGEWRLVDGPKDIVLMRRMAGTAAVLKLAGEIGHPGALCDIIGIIAQAAFHGELLILEEEGKSRSIYFDAGSVIGVATNLPEERLGETLYRFGVVTREQLEQTLEATKASGKRFGEALMELEFVTAEELFAMMSRQVEEVFYAVLQVSAGTFYFFDLFDDKAVLHRHSMNASALLMEGARRMDEMRFFRQKVPTEDYVPTPTANTKKPPDDLMEVFSQCDGRRSVAEIGRRIGQLEFEITRAVFQLLNGGFLSIASPHPEGPEAITGVFNRALVEVHRMCDTAGKGSELREGLARFATGAGIYDPLFMSAGPLPDGTFRGERVARNLAALAGDDPDAWLIQLFHEYVGFAMFQAESLLPRNIERALVKVVAEALTPVRASESLAPTSSHRLEGPPPLHALRSSTRLT
jgi:hypothetical protein